MSIRKTITSSVVSVTTAAALMGAPIFAPIAFGQTTADLQAQIAALLAQITALQAQLDASTGGATATACNFTRSLHLGMDNPNGDDIVCLQDYLTSTGHFTFSGGSTGYFGPITQSSVAAWQLANGVSPPAGYFGPISQAKYSSLAVVVPVPPVSPGTTPPVTPAGSGLTVTKAATQPEPGLHPDNAVRVPYTAVTFTASPDGAATVDSIVVERQGVSTDTAFSGVVLLDEDGVQVGLSKTLNSNHQATLSEDFTIPAGTSRTMWIAGNRTTGGADGTNAKFAVISVAATGGTAVSGSMPFTGTTHTLNVGGLAIGSVTVETGPSKSVATTTEDVGKTLTFTATRVTAGSVEKIHVKSFRWNQVGTAGVDDIGTLSAHVDQGGTVTDYPLEVSSDGKYYTAKFGDDVQLDKGESAEVYIRGELIGGTNRTIKFDIYRGTDMAFNGLLYGFGITPTNSTGFTTTNPVYFASQITVGKASLLVEKDPSISAQNIAINLSDQPLGGFTVDVKGEPISVAQLVFNLSTSGTGTNGSDITNITLEGPGGLIVAGPTDGVTANTVTFSDTVTFPIGKGSYALRGKLSTDIANNETVAASTTPSSDWTTVTGEDSGETITPTPSSAVTGNTMTVKTGALTISVSSVPVAQTVVAGSQQFTFANYQLDATQSGEDVRMNSVPLEYNIGGDTATNLTSCQLFDASTSVTSGSNVVNPTAAGSSTTFTFDGAGFIIPKSTVKTLALKCNIAGGATGTYEWGYDSSSSPTATGLTSGQSITITENDSEGQLMTLAASGSYTVVDDSTPGYLIVNSGATGVTLARLKFSAFDEDVDIQRVNFQLSSAASNTPLDLVGSQLSLYDEDAPTVLLGTAVFTNNGDYATSSLIASGSFRVPLGGSKTMIVKGDISQIAVSGQPLTTSGDLLVVDYDGGANGIANGNYGTGVDSGTNLSPSSADTGLSGVRIMRAYPTFAKVDLDSDEKLLQNGSDRTLYKFSATANNGEVHLYKLTFQVSSSTHPSCTGDCSTGATTSSFALYAYTDSNFSNADTTFVSDGLLNAGKCARNAGAGAQASTDTNATLNEIFMDKTGCMDGTTTYKIPSGATRYFALKATITGTESVSGTESIEVDLQGDAAYPTNQPSTYGPMDTPGGAFGTGIDDDTNDDIIWSPHSTTTSTTVNDVDYTNGYQLPGVPTSNMSSEILTSQN